MRNLSKLKIVYIFSLAVLAVLLVLAVFRPFATGSTYTEIARQSLLKTGDEWVLQFDILNHEGQDVKYNIRLLVNEQDYQENFIVRDGGKFTYVHHIRESNAGSGKVTYSIFRQGEVSPIEVATYYLK